MAAAPFEVSLCARLHGDTTLHCYCTLHEHIQVHSVTCFLYKEAKLPVLSPRANYTDRHLSAKLVKYFADRGCHVVSVTDAYCRIL
jgi:imidazolonepropionase-like amidohydrolase